MCRIWFVLVVCCFGLATRLFSQDKGNSYPTFFKNETPNYAEFSSNGKFIAAGVPGAVRIWETGSTRFKDYKTNLKNVAPLFVCFSPGDKYIASGVYGAVRVWEIDTDGGA